MFLLILDLNFFMADTIRVAVIGTADRQDQLNMDDFERMKVTTLCAIQELGYNPEEVVLVSGGAPYADHVAVWLYLNGKVAGLHLHLPGKLVSDSERTYLTDSNACVTFSRYHARFKEKTGLDGMAQIKQAIDQGASVKEYSGYFERNRAVAADCDALVAVHTIHKHPSLQSSGGTAYTFKQAAVPKLYIPFRDAKRKPRDYTKLGFSEFESIGIRNVFKRIRSFTGPINKFFKRKAEDQSDSGATKRQKSLPPSPL